MTAIVNALRPSFSFIPNSTSFADMAKSILADTQTGKLGHDIDKIVAHLSTLASQDARAETTVRGEVMKQLSPLEQGQLERTTMACKNAAAVEFARPFTSDGLTRAPGVTVITTIARDGHKIHTLTGDVRVKIENTTQYVTQTNDILKAMSNVNMSTFAQDGTEYKTKFTFKEASTNDNLMPSGNSHLTYQGKPYVVVRVANEVDSRAKALFNPNDRSLKIDSVDIGLSENLPHEVFHWLGLSHSGYQNSLMWPTTQNLKDTLKSQELINLVRGYM
jgi:hypothetical protein